MVDRILKLYVTVIIAIIGINIQVNDSKADELDIINSFAINGNSFDSFFNIVSKKYKLTDTILDAPRGREDYFEDLSHPETTMLLQSSGGAVTTFTVLQQGKSESECGFARMLFAGGIPMSGLKVQRIPLVELKKTKTMSFLESDNSRSMTDSDVFGYEIFMDDDNKPDVSVIVSCVSPKFFVFLRNLKR